MVRLDGPDSLVLPYKINLTLQRQIASLMAPMPSEGIIASVQELLSRSNDPNVPIQDREYYELCLEESMNTSEPSYIVRQTHFRWDESVSGAVRDEIESEECEMLQTAENLYVRRRKALADQGFIYSDMDPLI
jgi:hypothetical protein